MNFSIKASLSLLVFGVLLWDKHTDPVELVQDPKAPKIFARVNPAFLRSQVSHLDCISVTDIPDVPAVKPLNRKVEIASFYGMRLHPIFKRRKMHYGLDFDTPVGTPVLATADGVVAKVHPVTRARVGYGRYIELQHEEAFQNELYKTLYAHLSKILVKEGERVKRGEIIGYSGNSGGSTSPHLHYEVIRNGEKVNPIDYL